jgi:phage baseplate assembly protein gpV
LNDVVALLRQLIQAELATQLHSAVGVVEKAADHADGDNENYACDVRLRGRDVVLVGVPILTDHLGTVAIPSPGDVVLIQWVGSDGNQPVVVGRLYSEALRAPPYAAGEVHLVLPPDVEINITEKKVQVKVKKLDLTLDGDSGETTIKTDKTTITIKDGGDVTLEAGGNLTLKAKGDVEISATNLKLKASGNAELKGSMVSVGS